MKGNDKKGLHTKTKGELKALVNDIRRDITKMIVNSSTNKDKNVHGRNLRKKDLARALTVLKEVEQKNE